MHFLFGLLFGVIGSAVVGFTHFSILVGGAAGVVVGIMAAEIIALRTRVRGLEARLGQEAWDSPTKEQRAAVADLHEEPQAVEIDSKSLFSLSEQEESQARFPVVPGWYDRTYEAVASFFTGGNLVLKAGVIVFFFGISFLLKYAVQHSLLSVELRLSGAALGAIALLLVGWCLRKTRSGYGLTLQGAGVGTLYLVVFAAAKLYHLLPVPLSLALMIGLVCLSSGLAVLQDSRALAVFGALGGFAAPVLLSSGGGSHVLLFSYFALLNVGILFIAWFRSWRILNLIGFVSTFVIGTIWGHKAYRPAHFATTEPFLIFFFLLYVAVSVLFAHRQPVRLKGVVDTTLVFGVPLAAISLQYLLIQDFRYGMALSMLGLGIIYLLLTLTLIRKRIEGMTMLAEAFLALGIAFGSLAIPFAVDAKWTSSAWALEGGALVWIGIRQKRLVTVIFGLLLQLGAGICFIEAVWYPFKANLFANRHFIGCLFLAGSALFSEYYIGSTAGWIRWSRVVRALRFSLLIWGLFWWYYGGFREIVMHVPRPELLNGILLFTCGSIIALGMIARRLGWRDLARSLMMFLPVMTVMLLLQLSSPIHVHFLGGWGTVAWPISIFVQYRLLRHFENMWPEKWTRFWHQGSMWLMVVLICFEVEWLWSLLPGFSPVWGLCAWGLVPALVLVFMFRYGEYLAWPVGEHQEAYLGIGAGVISVFVFIWTAFTCIEAGDPAPAVYIPFINPLEMTQLIALTALVYHSVRSDFSPEEKGRATGAIRFWAIGLLGFVWINGIIARGVHVFLEVPFRPEPLFHSSVFQATVAALWGSIALAVTVVATRRGHRPLWIAGSILLALVVMKLFFIDLSGTGTVARIVSFLVVGVLMLVIGYFAPLPPKQGENG